jgi:hypothetical protein
MDERKPDEPRQKTPKGADVPVPKRREFLANLDRATKPDPPAEKQDRHGG